MLKKRFIFGLIILFGLFWICGIISEAKTFNVDGIADEYIKQNQDINVFIGDSRTVMLDYYLNLSEYPDTFVIAKSGMGYDWLESEAMPELDKIYNKNKDKKLNIVFNLGVNDLENLDKYVSMISKLKSYGDLYVVSVNPVIDRAAEIKTSDVEAFNKTMQEKADRYIDCYKFLQTTGFMTYDGLHFDEQTSKKIYDYIMLNLAVWQFEEKNGNKNVTTKYVQQILNM